MGRSFANLAPNKESHPIHPTQELPGSALRLSPVMDDRTISIAWAVLSILVPVLAVLMILSTLID